MTGARITVPTLRDADQLGRLHHLARGEMYQQVGAHAPRSTPEDCATRWRLLLQQVDSQGRDDRGCTLRTATTRDGVVGFAVAGPAREPAYEAMTELWALSVHPQWRGSGTAHALAREVLPTDSAYLWVLQGNDRAIAFYRRMGFTIDGATRVDESTGATEERMLRGDYPRIAQQ